MKTTHRINTPQKQRGQVLPFVAVCLVVLLGFVGLAVDLGYLQYEQRQQQSAADAGAIAGAQALEVNGCPSRSAAITAAQNDAASNGFTNATGGVVVEAYNPPASPSPFSGDNCAVEVTVYSPHPTWFSSFFGMNGAITTQAIAAVTSGDGCIYLLDQNAATQNFNSSTIQTPRCGILINGNTPNFNGASVCASNIGYSGQAPNENGTNFNGCAMPAPIPVVADPCPKIAGCNTLATSSDNSPTGCISVSAPGGTYTMTPGCYQSANFNGANITMTPGLYIFNGPINFNGATITGNGVTMYVTTSGQPPNFNGTGNSLSACSTTCLNGAIPGVLYYQNPANTLNPNFNGTNDGFGGLMYAPGAAGVNFNGSSLGGGLVLVFGGINDNGGNITITATPPPSDEPTAVTLAQ